jgi:hypothetical protein
MKDILDKVDEISSQYSYDELISMSEYAKASMVEVLTPANRFTNMASEDFLMEIDGSKYYGADSYINYVAENREANTLPGIRDGFNVEEGVKDFLSSIDDLKMFTRKDLDSITARYTHDQLSGLLDRFNVLKDSPKGLKYTRIACILEYVVGWRNYGDKHLLADDGNSLLMSYRYDPSGKLPAQIKNIVEVLFADLGYLPILLNKRYRYSARTTDHSSLDSIKTYWPEEADICYSSAEVARYRLENGF